MYDETKLSVIIVNSNAKYVVEQCLFSVKAALSGMEAEIFVVDNHSSDGSPDYLRSVFPEVVYMENKEPIGLAKARNQAIRQCTGEYILLLKPDTVIGEELIRNLCFFMDEHPKAGAAGVKMLDAHGVFVPESKRSFPTPWVTFCQLSGLSRLFSKSPVFSRYTLPYLNENKQHRVEVLSGVCLFLRHEALDKTGLPDEAFDRYGEDIDLSYRMVAEGYRNYYIPERILYYTGEKATKEDARYDQAFYEAMAVFYKKYYPRSGWVMGLFIRLVIWSKAVFCGLGWKKKVKNKHSRLLVICREEQFEEMKAACVKRMPQLEFVNKWDLGENRVMDAICRRNQMKGFTDIAFCYPEVRFEQMLFFMDTLVNKKTTYHIFNRLNKQLVSPDISYGTVRK